MPTYEYRCKECGNELEVVQSFTDDALTTCERCGGMLKSGTISFGEQLVVADLERAEAASTTCDLLLAVGTSLAVYPIAAVVPLAVRNGARLVIVNAEPTPFDDLADAVVRGQIGRCLPAIVG